MATPYLDVLDAYFEPPAAGPRRVAESGGRPAAVSALCASVETMRAGLPGLAGRGAVRPHATGYLDTALRRLAGVCAAYDAEAFEDRAAATYADAEAFRRDVETALAAERAPEMGLELIGMLAWAEGASVPEERAAPPLHELAIDRQLVLQRLWPAAAFRAPQQVEEMRAHYQVFQRRYRERYVAHHASYQEWAAGEQGALTRDAAALQALVLCNGIGALGAAVGVDLAGRFNALRGELRRCELDAAGVEAQLAEAPVCGACGLPLSEAAPREALAGWRRDLEEALRTQQERLARALVERVLAEPNGADLERVLRAARAADVGPLVGVMDAATADLIGRLLGTGSDT